jgi:hypothetical protein
MTRKKEKRKKGPKCELGPLYKTTTIEWMPCLLRRETPLPIQWRKKIDCN